MPEDGFSLIRIFLYKHIIVDSVLIRKHAGQRKPVFYYILRSDCLGSSKAVAKLFQSYREIKKTRFLLFKAEVQSWKKYMRQTLVFMGDSAIRENFNFFFSAVFCWYQKHFSLGGRLGTR